MELERKDIPNVITDTDLVTALIHVESRGNDSAIGDRHLVGNEAVGALQIRPIMVREVNRICKRIGSNQRFTLKDRLNAIDYAIRSTDNLGLVIIDGIADLVSDVNSIDESNEVVQMLMKWTEVYKCHIITVIHTNWGSTKPTGHLGSALQKKCETEIHLVRNEFDASVIDVKCKSSRGRK